MFSYDFCFVVDFYIGACEAWYILWDTFTSNLVHIVTYTSHEKPLPCHNVAMSVYLNVFLNQPKFDSRFCQYLYLLIFILNTNTNIKRSCKPCSDWHCGLEHLCDPMAFNKNMVFQNIIDFWFADASDFHSWSTHM